MSGHSKWSKIKHQKAAKDGKRSKVFQKISKEIYISAREKGSNPDSNSSLRLILLKAKAANMPKTIIDKALNKSKVRSNVNWEEFEYEGYGVGGSGFIVKCISDNRNRTASHVKSIFKKYGGTLASGGAVKYLFNFLGKIYITASGNEEQVLETMLMIDIDNYKSIGENEYEIFTDPQLLNKIVTSLNGSENINVESFGLEYVPLQVLKLNDAQKESCYKLKDALLDSEDIQEVFDNIELN